MEKNRSRFDKWLIPYRTATKSLSRTRSAVMKGPTKFIGNGNAPTNKKCMSLDRMEIDSCANKMDFLQIDNSKQIFSSLQPEIYASLDSSSSETDFQSNCSASSFSHQNLKNITKELALRTDTVTRAFEILEIIYSDASKVFVTNTEKYNTIEKIFKDLKCMSNFHELYRKELNSVIRNDFPLSMVFTNQVINSALNWYKIFYTTFEGRNSLLSSFYQQDFQFKLVADKAIIKYTQRNPDVQAVSLSWILSSIKDSLFHFETLLARYSECLDDNLEKSRINDAIRLIQNILQSCNMQCDYNDFMKTQHEYNNLSTTEPLSPSVRFVHKGVVHKLNRQNSHIRQRMIFLFTHMIFITSKSAQFYSYKIKHQLHLSTCNFFIINFERNSMSKRGLRLECSEFKCEFLIEKETDFVLWIEKLNSTICQAKLRKNSFDRKIKKFLVKNDDEEEDLDANIGIEIPVWQLWTQSNFCNGYDCTTRFTANQKRQNCSGDGLIYCENCLIYSSFISYSNDFGLSCKECSDIISNHSNQKEAFERQMTKRKRIQRKGLIKGWLTINKLSSSLTNSVESQQKLFCVLNSDCTIYTYELPEDKYHHLPIRALQAKLWPNDPENRGSSFNVLEINKNGTKYSIKADCQEDAQKWIQSIRCCQLENLQSL